MLYQGNLELNCFQSCSTMVLKIYLNREQSLNSDVDIQQLLKELQEDPIKHPKYSWHRGELRRKGKLVIGSNRDLKLFILKWLHDSPVGGHSDRDTTAARVRSLFFWKGMVKDIQQYVRHCDVCQTSFILRCMCSDKPASWSKWLALAEWWYNTNFHSSIHTTPYEVVYGQAPPIHLPYFPGEAPISC